MIDYMILHGFDVPRPVPGGAPALKKGNVAARVLERDGRFVVEPGEAFVAALTSEKQVYVADAEGPRAALGFLNRRTLHEMLDQWLDERLEQMNRTV